MSYLRWWWCWLASIAQTCLAHLTWINEWTWVGQTWNLSSLRLPYNLVRCMFLGQNWWYVIPSVTPPRFNVALEKRPSQKRKSVSNHFLRWICKFIGIYIYMCVCVIMYICIFSFCRGEGFHNNLTPPAKTIGSRKWWSRWKLWKLHLKLH